jgi:hypothetical protein
VLIASGLDRPAVAGLIIVGLVGVLLWAEAKISELRAEPSQVRPVNTLEPEETDGV